jgi:hypothetical protein
MTTYKTVGQCGDGGQRLERKSRQSSLAEGCEGSQSPPNAVVLLLLLKMMMIITYDGQKFRSLGGQFLFVMV